MGKKKSFIFLILFLSFFAKANDKTEKKVIRIMERIEKAIQNENPDFFINIFDNKFFYDKILIKENNNKNLLNLNNGFRENIGFVHVKEMVDLVKEGGYYDAIKVERIAEYQYTLLFRVYSKNGLNYYKYSLRKKENSKDFRIVDIFDFKNGQFLSQTLRETYLPMASNISKQTITVDELSYLTYLLKYRLAKNFLKQGKIEDALILIDTQMDSKFKNNPECQLLTLQLLDPASTRFKNLLQEYQKENDNLFTFNLLSVDKNFFTKDYTEVLKNIDVIDQHTNDGLLELFRGTILKLQNKPSEALVSFSKFANTFKERPEAYHQLLGIYYDQENIKGFIHTLDRIDANIDMDLELFKRTMKELYPKFYNTKKVNEWLQKTKS